mgnify:CR=1 FL=1
MKTPQPHCAGRLPCLALLVLSQAASAQDALTASTSSAARRTIAAAELPGSAQSLDRGQFLLHPLFLPSTLGVSESLDLTCPLLGLLEGPSLALKWTALDTERLALSIEPFFDSNATGDGLEGEEGSGSVGGGVRDVGRGAAVRGPAPSGAPTAAAGMQACQQSRTKVRNAFQRARGDVSSRGGATSWRSRFEDPQRHLVRL